MQCPVVFQIIDHIFSLNILLLWLWAFILSLSPWWLGWVAPGTIFGLHLFLLPLLSCFPPQGSILNSQAPLCILTACGQFVSKCKCPKPDTRPSPRPAPVPTVLISPTRELGKAGLVLSLCAHSHPVLCTRSQQCG